MNRIILSATVAVVMLLGSSLAVFAEESAGDDSGHKSGHKHHGAMMMKKMDKDGDGKVSKEEAMAHRQKMHDKFKERREDRRENMRGKMHDKFKERKGEWREKHDGMMGGMRDDE